MESPNVKELIDYLNDSYPTHDYQVNQMYDQDYIKDCFNELQHQVDDLRFEIEELKVYLKIINVK